MIPNKNLLIVVLTQNKRCNIIPETNQVNNEIINDFILLLIRPSLTRIKKLAPAANNVNRTSKMAMLNTLYECIPFPGSPRALEY